MQVITADHVRQASEQEAKIMAPKAAAWLTGEQLEVCYRDDAIVALLRRLGEREMPS